MVILANDRVVKKDTLLKNGQNKVISRDENMHETQKP